MKPTFTNRSDCSRLLRTVNVIGNFPPKRFESDEKKAGDTHSVTVPSGQRSYRIVLQCRHGRFPMTNIISQAVSAALCRVPAGLHRSARTIVRPSTLTIAPDFRQRKFNASRYRVRNYGNKRNCTRSVPNIIISSTFFFYVLFCNFFLVFERNYFLPFFVNFLYLW